MWDNPGGTSVSNGLAFTDSLLLQGKPLNGSYQREKHKVPIFYICDVKLHWLSASWGESF